MIRRGVKIQLVVVPASSPWSASATSAPATSGSATCCPGLGLRRHRRLRRVRRHLRERRGDLPRRRRRPGRPAPARRRRRARRPAARAAASRCPRDTDAVVANRSAVGEQYVDLQPSDPGRAVPRRRRPDRQRPDTARRCTPRPCCSTWTGWSTRWTKRDLVVGHRRAGQGLRGHRSGPAAAARLRRRPDPAAVDALPETIRLIEDGQTVLATQRDSGSAIASFSADLADLSDTLRDQRRRPAQGPRQRRRRLPAAARRCIRTNRTAISALLANLLVSGQVTVARLDGVEQMLVTYPDNVAGGYTVVPGDGTSHFGLVLNAADPPVCTQGYGGTDKRTPAGHVRAPRPTPTPAAPLPRGSARRSAGRRTRRRPRRRSGAQRPPAGRTGTRRASPFRRRTWPGTTRPAGSALRRGRQPPGARVRRRPAQAFGKDSWNGCCSDR